MNRTTAYYFRLLMCVCGIAVSVCAKAQICSGSLGDPIVNITFNNGTGSSSIAPNYKFTSSSCPDDGFYTVTSQTMGCFGNSWHNVLSDHTGGGNFMLVNASYDPGDFFVDTVSGLCPNTTYEFAAWVMNVLNRPGGGIRPNLTFSIETTTGIVVSTYYTGDIDGTPTPMWKQYGFFFRTPSVDTKIVLRITNNAPGGIGNDIALDDITFRACGASISADIVNQPVDTINLCEGDPSNFDFRTDVSSAYVNPVFFWQSSLDSGKTWNDIPGANSATFQHRATGAGSYWYRLTVVESTTAGIKACRIASNVLAINIHAKPTVDAGPNKVLLKGNSGTLNGSASGEEIETVWTPGSFVSNPQILRPEINPEADIRYTLSATSKYGCSNEDTVFVRVVDGIYVPNAFTPNGDGKNDLWRIPFLDPSFEAEVSLFNRYGQLVYRSKANEISWDGKVNGQLQPSGVYVYYIKFGKVEFKGMVTLIR